MLVGWAPIMPTSAQCRQWRGIHHLRADQMGPGEGHLLHPIPAVCSNDDAHVEQKNGNVVRWHAFPYRKDTAAELKLLNPSTPLSGSG